MESGILYVVFNRWIRDPETNEMPYKIGITKISVDDRYYGLGLKMPGVFETLFAYRIKDYAKAERSIQDFYSEYCVNGEWFKLNQNELDNIKEKCIRMGGELITDEIKKEIEIEIKTDIKTGNVNIQMDNYDVASEIKKIERKIDGWFLNKNQINSKILYAFIKLYEQNDGTVTYEHLKNESKVKKFKGNFDQMKNFGKKNHGKIFDQVGQNISFWEKVENIIWNKYKEYGVRTNGI